VTFLMTGNRVRGRLGTPCPMLRRATRG
jgi:hypothetical protein